MADASKKVGFDVTVKNNLDKEGMRRAVSDFSTKVHSSEIALVYFRGHGLQAEGVNYLLPTDFPQSFGEVDLPDLAYSGTRVQEALDKRGRQ